MPFARVGIFFTIGYGQCHFRELDNEAQHGDEPHPEYGTGTAGGNSDGYAGNIADPQSRRQGRAGCLEGIDIAFARAFIKNLAKGFFHDQAKMAELEKPEPDRHVNRYK